MSKIELTTGEPVPADRSHTEINPLTGQQKGYIVLSPEERAKGFVKPVRSSYIHERCGGLTSMGRSLSETYARDPYFYSGTFCCGCGGHFDLDQFHWSDGEPMDPLKQEDWGKEQQRIKENRETLARIELEKKERAEYWRLKAKYFPDSQADSINLKQREMQMAEHPHPYGALYHQIRAQAFESALIAIRDFEPVVNGDYAIEVAMPKMREIAMRALVGSQADG